MAVRFIHLSVLQVAKEFKAILETGVQKVSQKLDPQLAVSMHAATSRSSLVSAAPSRRSEAKPYNAAIASLGAEGAILT